MMPMAQVVQQSPCIPVEISGTHVALRCCDVERILPAGSITPMPGAPASLRGLSTDGVNVWVVGEILLPNAPAARLSTKSRVICLAGEASSARLGVICERIGHIDAALFRKCEPGSFGPVSYDEVAHIEGRALPLLTAAAILESINSSLIGSE